MKKLVLLITLSLLLVCFVYADNYQINKMSTSISAAKASRAEGEFLSEGFEGDFTWTHFDGSVPAHMWHLQNNNPLVYQTTGYSWDMGKMDLGTNGGYMNSQYLVLDTPTITVPTTNPTLTFKLNYAVEALGADGTGYTGWDGCNVRISVNGGAWTVIEPVAPAYNCTSLFSFGSIHGEGLGVKGWGGTSNGWQDASFNLTTYAGQDVKIRFAFASDGAYATAEAPALFGMLVDNVSLGTFNYDFNDNDAHGMTFTSLVPQGGDEWHVEEFAQAPSPSHVLVCQNATNTYNTNMDDYVETGLITLPNSTEIRADFMIRGAFTDPDAFPACEYFGWQISIDNGATWRAMSNPYADSSGQNYVFSDAPAEFASFVESYTGADGYISNFAGQQVKFRWFFHSDADTPNGEGIMIDDFKIYYNMFAPVPSNLTAVKNGNNVDLSWTAPGAGGQTGWVELDSGENPNNNGVGFGAATTFECAFKVSAENMLAYTGGQISKIKFYAIENVPFTVKVWTGGNGNTIADSQVVATVTPQAWNEVVLTTPVTVQTGVDYWFGYTVVQTAAGQHPAGMDEGPHVLNGDMFRQRNGSWQSIYAAGQAQNPPVTIDGNWNIGAYIQVAPGKEIAIDRAIDGYKVFRSATPGADYQLINTSTGTATTYSDVAATVNAVNYYVVSSVWDGITSTYSNEASAYMHGNTVYEYLYDDGVKEAEFAHLGLIANKFTPNYDSIQQRIKISTIKFFISTKTASSMMLKVFKANPTNNTPYTDSIFFSQTLSPSMLNVGWNYIIIPEANQPELTSGDFYIGFQENAGSSKIGVDNNNSGRSYKKTPTGDWTVVDGSTYMIRCFINRFTGSEDVVVSPTKLSAKNYPNPFNPETQITFNMPAKGHVSVKVYNSKGQLVKTLLNSSLDKGTKSISWNGTDKANKNVASGVYFYKVETAGQSVMNKMLLMK